MPAAAPPWFADNLLLIAAGTLAVLAVAVLRMIQKATLRAALLGVLAVVALLVYANRRPLEECARTCECDLAGRHVTVPICDDSVDL